MPVHRPLLAVGLGPPIGVHRVSTRFTAPPHLCGPLLPVSWILTPFRFSFSVPESHLSSLCDVFEFFVMFFSLMFSTQKCIKGGLSGLSGAGVWAVELLASGVLADRPVARRIGGAQRRQPRRSCRG